MKIRDKFIESVEKATKKREYRLNDELRRSIKIGDILVLVSNIDKHHFVRARVNKIEYFPDWESSLKQYWSDDFSSLFDSFDKTLSECLCFYSKEEVQKYGIVVFGIESEAKRSLKDASILLDTNIVIQRESYNNVSYEVAETYNWMDKLHSKKYVHPNIKEDISKYVDSKIKENLLVKIDSYEKLPLTKENSEFFSQVIKSYSSNENDIVDNELLYQAYSGSVDFLLTNDREMLRKADSLYIKDYVLSIAEYLDNAEKEFPDQINYKMLQVKKQSFADVDLNSPFFQSLKEDYNPGFDEWFAKKRKLNEPAYVYKDEGTIKGFLYIKIEDKGEEDYKDIEPKFSLKKRLKIGTFKIDKTGIRVGERFLKIIFDNALRQNVDEIYVTLFEDKRPEVKALYDLLTKWGFEKWGNKSNGEIVLTKIMKAYSLSKNPKFNFPNIKDKPNYFFLPIEPEYHTDLFPDSILTNEDVKLYEGGRAHRYALEKVYVSSKSTCYIDAKPGDVLLIYRKGDRWPKKYSSVVTGEAIFESAGSPNTLEDYLKECKNITVVTELELRSFFNNQKYRTVIKLIYFETFKNKVTLDFLQHEGIIKIDSGARPFDPLSEMQFRSIINKAREGENK